MKLTHRFAQLTPEKRPHDPNMDGTGLRFETLEHGGEYPDTMPKRRAVKCASDGGRRSIPSCSLGRLRLSLISARQGSLFIAGPPAGIGS
jgi:hypothetical protein